MYVTPPFSTLMEGVYTTLVGGLMSSNGHAGSICVSDLSNIYHHFGDLSIV
jgi:hypothetical protein